MTIQTGLTCAAGDSASASSPDGSLAGTVTSASSSSPLANICVYLYPVGNGSAVDGGDLHGDGRHLSVLRGDPGSYDVAFADPPGYYSTQWYNGTSTGASSQSGATPITVPSGNGTLSGIDAAMVAVPYGSLAGTVTSASSSSPLGDICVYLYQVGNSTAATFASCTVTGGSYQFSGVTSGPTTWPSPTPARGTTRPSGTTGPQQEPPASPGRCRSPSPPGTGRLAASTPHVARPLRQVRGVVTTPRRTALADICVYLYQVGNGTAPAAASCTLANGSYSSPG